MANPEHFEIVKQGAEAIRNWRMAHPLEKFDLIEAELSGINLRGADLSAADLSSADLSITNLYEADLSNANLIKVDLRGANVIGADLRRADLRGANLCAANIWGTELSKCNLENLRSWLTIWADVDLSDVKGLELVAGENRTTIVLSYSIITMELSQISPTTLVVCFQPRFRRSLRNSKDRFVIPTPLNISDFHSPANCWHRFSILK